MKSRDIQIKFKVHNIEEFLNMLSRDNFILVGGTFETITRYDFEDDRLEKEGIFIRTKDGFDNTITLKEKTHHQTQFKYFERKTLNFEIENCEDMKYLLNKIGLTNTYTMQKYRIVWKKGRLTINIDELPFGVYCDIRACSQDIDKFINRYNIKSFYNCTYWEIYDEIEPNHTDKNILFKSDHIFKLTSLI